MLTKNQLFNNLNNAFSEDFQQVHLVAFTFSESVFKADNLKQIVNTFNQQKFESQRLSSSYLNFSPVNKTGILFINSFKTKSAAEIYRKLLEEELVKQGLKSDSNFHNFAISRDNFTQLFQNKALEEYLTFHQKFYK